MRLCKSKMSGGKGNTHTPQNGVLLRNKTDISPFRRYARFAFHEDMKTVKGQDKRAAPALDGFSCPCHGTIKRAQTDRPLAPSLNYGVFCYAVGFEKSCIHAALQKQNEWRQGEYSYPSKWRSTATKRTYRRLDDTPVLACLAAT